MHEYILYIDLKPKLSITMNEDMYVDTESRYKYTNDKNYRINLYQYNLKKCIYNSTSMLVHYQSILSTYRKICQPK